VGKGRAWRLSGSWEYGADGKKRPSPARFYLGRREAVEVWQKSLGGSEWGVARVSFTLFKK